MANPAVIWHDAECGSYDADLPLWEALARDYPGSILELGCGTGRVLLHLGSRGFDVTGLDRDEALVAAARRRLAERGIEARALEADACDFAFADRFGVVLAPMQLLQLLDSRDARARALRCARDHLAPGGLLALAIVEGTPIPGGVSEAERPLPDVVETDGWIYSSLPIDIASDGDRLVITRLRQVVSPAGDLTEEVDEVRLAILEAGHVEEEAARVGLRPWGRRDIPTTESHLGSTVILLEPA